MPHAARAAAVRRERGRGRAVSAAWRLNGSVRRRARPGAATTLASPAEVPQEITAPKNNCTLYSDEATNNLEEILNSKQIALLSRNSAVLLCSFDAISLVRTVLELCECGRSQLLVC
jgi:hypothetical protein